MQVLGHPDASLFPTTTSSKWRDCKSFQKVVDHMCEGRVLFCTESGFMGLGPDWMCIGDEVCILKGGRVPYILRHAEDGYYNLIGECYVAGAMNGELVSASRSDCRRPTRRVIV
jgi:hypothetical protein